ncbi:MAG: DJ-1/PfpI family protein [Clostridia bacterium]|nr:DJ-1/PfpI family protein [Clostridia bacterium]MBO7319106.1 DJ-1/PfpI family protein [Clostridia bacterium]
MVYCFLADGFEEVEAIAPIDMLRRAGVEVKTVGVTGEVIDGRHGIRVIPDIDIKDITLDESLEAVILPGGLPGATNLEESAEVQNAIDFANANGKLICAICAAPQILGHKGLLDGKEAIAYPGFEDELKGAIISENYVVRDGNFITAKGAGVATEFGLEIVAALKDKALADEIGKAILMK